MLKNLPNVKGGKSKRQPWWRWICPRISECRKLFVHNTPQKVNRPQRQPHFYLVSFHGNVPAAALAAVVVTGEIPTGELTRRHHQLLRAAASWIDYINHTWGEKHWWSADALATTLIQASPWFFSACSSRLWRLAQGLFHLMEKHETY